MSDLPIKLSKRALVWIGPVLGLGFLFHWRLAHYVPQLGRIAFYLSCVALLCLTLDTRKKLSAWTWVFGVWLGWFYFLYTFLMRTVFFRTYRQELPVVLLILIFLLVFLAPLLVRLTKPPRWLYVFPVLFALVLGLCPVPSQYAFAQEGELEILRSKWLSKITSPKKSEHEQILDIYQFVCQNLKHGRGAIGVSADKILDRQQGTCSSASKVVSHLAVAAGQSARIVQLRGSETKKQHVVAEVFFNDKWRMIDANFCKLYLNKQDQLLGIKEIFDENNGRFPVLGLDQFEIVETLVTSDK